MLTDAQMIDVRRYMGYAVVGTYPITDEQDVVYGNFGMVTMSLHRRLTTLLPGEETVLIGTYLANLATLETAIVGTSDNLDTDQAAVWTHNKRERQDREALFDSWRRRMCDFIGFKPGPGLNQSNAIKVVRS